MDAPIWEKFYWCGSGCNTYHDRTHRQNVHYAMVVEGQRLPDSNNWPGTPEERERYIAWLSIREMDYSEKVTAMNRRIDTFINSGQPAHSLPTH